MFIINFQLQIFTYVADIDVRLVILYWGRCGEVGLELGLGLECRVVGLIGCLVGVLVGSVQRF